MTMARCSICLLIILQLVGCAKITPINRETTVTQIGVEHNTNIGDVFFEREQESGQNNSINGDWIFNANRIELVVRSATNDKLGLDYSEYFKSGSGAYREITYADRWLKKQAFDKSLEYDLKESRNVLYKDYEFEILSVKGGRIKYKRIR